MLSHWILYSVFSTNIINWKYFGIIFLKIGNGQVGMLLLYYLILINEMNIYKSMKKKKQDFFV